MIATCLLMDMSNDGMNMDLATGNICLYTMEMHFIQ
jgi:hypothetical protein